MSDWIMRDWIVTIHTHTGGIKEFVYPTANFDIVINHESGILQVTDKKQAIPLSQGGGHRTVTAFKSWLRVQEV